MSDLVTPARLDKGFFCDETVSEDLSSSVRAVDNQIVTELGTPKFGTNLWSDFQGLVQILTMLGLTSEPLRLLNWYEKLMLNQEAV